MLIYKYFKEKKANQNQINSHHSQTPAHLNNFVIEVNFRSFRSASDDFCNFDIIRVSKSKPFSWRQQVQTDQIHLTIENVFLLFARNSKPRKSAHRYANNIPMHFLIFKSRNKYSFAPLAYLSAVSAGKQTEIKLNRTAR